MEKHTSPAPLSPQWAIELNNPPTSRPKNTSNIRDPPGFSAQRSAGGKQRASQMPARKPPTQEETETLKLKKSWEIALAPGKQLPMQLIMSYMSGNSLQIFSLMMVAMLFKGPFQAIVAANSTFTKLETERNKGKMIFVKATYVGMQCLLLTLGVWKIGQMGLLPTTQSDWVAFEDQRMCLEKAYFAT